MRSIGRASGGDRRVLVDSFRNRDSELLLSEIVLMGERKATARVPTQLCIHPRLYYDYEAAS